MARKVIVQYGRTCWLNFRDTNIEFSSSDRPRPSERSRYIPLSSHLYKHNSCQYSHPTNIGNNDRVRRVRKLWYKFQYQQNYDKHFCISCALSSWVYKQNILMKRDKCENCTKLYTVISNGTIFSLRFEVFTAVTMNNAVFWDINTQFVPYRRHITSQLQSPAR
jgi:hypothetical protein